MSRVEHIKKAQKAKSKAVEKSKTKVKSAAHKVVDVVTPDHTEHGPEWKKEVLEGRQKQRKHLGSISKGEDGHANADGARGSSGDTAARTDQVSGSSDTGKVLLKK